MAQNCGPVRIDENGKQYRLSPKGNQFMLCCDCEYYEECVEEAKIHYIDDEDLA